MRYLGPPQSGSLANIVYSRNQYGQYTRPRTSPTQPGSTYASVARTLFAATVARWNTITDAQRNHWIEFATSKSLVSSLGVKRPLDGRTLFIKVNQVSTYFGAVNYDDPPGLPSWDLASASLAWSGSGAGTVLSVDWSPVPATGVIVLYGSPVVSAGCMRPTSAGRLLGWQTVTLSAFTPPFSTGLKVNWGLRFGTLPSSGQASWFGYRQYFGGWLSPLVTLRVVR